MRDIKFRGKSFGNGEFVFGDLTRYSEEMSYITVDLIEGEVYQVDSKTVGQFTGLKNGNGQEIYEGDICRYSYINPLNGEKKTITWKVEYSPGVFWLSNIDGNKQDTLLWMRHESVEVIGNIYENPELLEIHHED